MAPKAKKICTCKSHCLTYNPATGQYEGEGHMISTSLRKMHRQDDAVKARSGSGISQDQVMSEVGLQNGSSSQAPPSGSGSASFPDNCKLLDLQEEVATRSLWLSPQPLEFRIDPLNHIEVSYQRLSLESLRPPNSGLHALKDDSPMNSEFLRHEYRLCEILDIVKSMPGSEESEALENRVYQALFKIDHCKELEWLRRQSEARLEENCVNTDPYFLSNEPIHPSLSAVYLTVLVMHVLFHLPRRATGWLLRSFRVIFGTSKDLEPLAESIPKDPRTVVNKYFLDPITRDYVSCPACFCLYPFPRGAGEGPPDNCQHRRTKTCEPCNAPLWRELRIGEKKHKLPRRKYLHQDMAQWLGRLLSRPGVEDVLDEPRNRAPRHPMKDIWDGDVFWELRGADLKPFLPGPKDEARLVFSLAIDSFNPFHLKEAKQTASSTGIWMVLLNFPPHQRYLLENMFLVGIIPGPGKPSLDDINHALDLVVDDLLKLWSKGIWLSRTAKYALGRLIRAMFIPLISDMLGARQAAGYSSVTSKFFCTCCRLEISRIEVLDKASWPPRSPEEDKRLAENFRDAANRSEQDTLVKTNGIRWSSLHRLPYWIPSDYSSVDTMHDFDLGLIQTHCREAWGINISLIGGDGTALRDEETPPRPSDALMLRCVELIKENPENLRDTLLGKNHAKNVLWYICYDNGLRWAGSKIQLVNTIVEWRRTVEPHHVQFKPTRTPGIATGVPTAGSSAGIQTTESDSPRHDASDSDIVMSGLQSPASESAALTESSGTNEGVDDLRIRSQAEEEMIERGSRMILKDLKPGTVLSGLRRRALCCMCFDRGLPTEGTKADLYARLKTWAQEQLEHDPDAPEKANHEKNRHILGKDIMEAVYSDMELTVLPSWVDKPPRDWGTPRRGKLSANHWRVIATVHLPITLIRLWGRSDAPVRKQDLLANFLDLVYAVQLGTLREVSRDHVALYRKYMNRYLEGYKRLFRDRKIKPIHHVALHIDEFLLRFGPDHAHSSPFYERHIHLLQEMNMNNRFGELEVTMLTASVRAANLRALMLGDPTFGGKFNELVQAYQLLDMEDNRGTRLANMLATDASTPPPRTSGKADFYLSVQMQGLLRTALSEKYGSDGDAPPSSSDADRIYPFASLPRTAWSHTQIPINGVRYSTRSKFFRDSHVMFLDSERHHEGSWRAGQIQQIFTVEHLDPQQAGTVHSTFLLLEEFETVGDMKNYMLDLQAQIGPGSENDDSAKEELLALGSLVAAIEPVDISYRGSGSAFGFLCSTSKVKARIVSEDRVVSHLARTPYSAATNHDIIHVLPLDRLMRSTAFDDLEAEAAQS